MHHHHFVFGQELYKKKIFIREKKVKELRKKLKNEYMTKSVENLLYSLGKKKLFPVPKVFLHLSI